MDTTLVMTEHEANGGSTKIFQLKGPLVISNLFDFQSAMRGCQAPDLVLDMKEVPYIDSSAVGVLVGAYVSRDKAGRSLLLVGVNERVRTILRVTKVEQFFEFAEQLPEQSAGA